MCSTIGPALKTDWWNRTCFGDEVERSVYVDPTTGEILQSLETVNIYPVKHFVSTQRPTGKAPSPLSGKELKQRLDVLNSPGPAA